jgi:outer membrane murein-binding lipoprotein Lpp
VTDNTRKTSPVTVALRKWNFAKAKVVRLESRVASLEYLRGDLQNAKNELAQARAELDQLLSE